MPTRIGTRRAILSGCLGRTRKRPVACTRCGGATGDNFTRNFPTHPSGYATFGTACFETSASLVVKLPKDITVTYVSDEFNGATTDSAGVIRPKWQQTFTLKQAIEQNQISQIYFGVHWILDATGGGAVGKAIAVKAAAAFA